VIKAESVSKKYGAHLALDNLSFQVERGEICGFLGPNGAGKTSMMRILTGFMPPTSGRASVAGFDTRENPLEVKRNIGYLPESTPLYPDMRVAEYLDFVAELKGARRRDERIKEVAGAMEITGITHRQRSLIKTLSKGLKQRVGLAQALIGDPQALVLDEPTIGLDPRQIVEIRSLIKDLAGRRTVILSSHILPEIQMICSRVLIINNGRLVASDTLTGLSGGMGRKISVRLAGDMKRAQQTLADSDGASGVELRKSSETAALFDIFLLPEADPAQWRQWLIKTAGEKGWDVMDLISSAAIPLEETYIRLISRDDDRAGEREISATVEDASPAAESHGQNTGGDADGYSGGASHNGE